MNDRAYAWGGVYSLIAVCLSLHCPLCAKAAQLASREDRTASQSSTLQSSGPFCGLYCLYASMQLVGRRVDFIDLLKQDYVGSRKGSSLDELARAAHDHQMYAVSLGSLSSGSLRRCSHRVILHVKSTPTSREYDHYELFLGVKDGTARIFDPPNPVRLVPFPELVARWDGEGLVVSAAPIDLGPTFTSMKIRFILSVTGVIVVVLLIHGIRHFVSIKLPQTAPMLLGLSFAQGAAFVLVALLCGMFYHFIRDEGLLSNVQGAKAIRQAHASNFVPRVTAREVRKLLDHGAVLRLSHR